MLDFDFQYLTGLISQITIFVKIRHPIDIHFN